VAAATKLLAKSGVCIAVLNYDDATLLATGITIANIGGAEAITFYVILDTQTFSRTISAGQTSIIAFPSSILCSIGVSAISGVPNLAMAGITEYGIGSA
jgi:hypothetical protein